MTKLKKKVTIIGSGAFGTALGCVLSENGHDTMLYGIDPNEINDVNELHINSKYFKDLKISESLKATTDLSFALEDVDFIITAVPTVVLKSAIEKVDNIVKNPFILVNASKGLDPISGEIMSESLPKLIKNEKLLKGYGGIYGPSIAEEVIEKKTTCMMSVSKNADIAKSIKELFNNDYFLTFESTDITATEYSASLKNVIAIAVGVSDEIFASDNTRSCLITMGLNEILLFSKFKEQLNIFEFGHKNDSLANYAEIGDLILTTTSVKSRNYKLGREIGKTKDAKLASINVGKTVEGMLTIQSLNKDLENLRCEYEISLPLLDTIYSIIVGTKKPENIFDIIGKKPSIRKLIKNDMVGNKKEFKAIPNEMKQ